MWGGASLLRRAAPRNDGRRILSFCHGPRFHRRRNPPIFPPHPAPGRRRHRPGQAEGGARAGDRRRRASARRWCCTSPRPASAPSASSIMTGWSCPTCNARSPTPPTASASPRRCRPPRPRTRSIRKCASSRHELRFDADNAADLIASLRRRLRRHRQFRHTLPGRRCLRARAPHPGVGGGAAVRGAALGVQAAHRRTVLPLPVPRGAAGRHGADMQLRLACWAPSPA